jgi:hypothetical protein
MDKVALGQVFSKYFGFPCHSSFRQFLHNHYHLSSEAGTIGQPWPQYQVGCLMPLIIIIIIIIIIINNNNNNNKKSQVTMVQVRLED